MTTSINQTPLTQISKADLKPFVVQSALLSLIDPVRQKPTRTLLDESPESGSLSGQQLKQKFLDSFALICSTSNSGAESASAVCLEQYSPTRTILRVARNHGLSQKDFTAIESVLQMLQVVARKETPSKQTETEILGLIVELDRGRILSLVEKVEKRGILTCLQRARSRLAAKQVKQETLEKSGLKLWLEGCPFAAVSCQSWNSVTIANLIIWASQARWLYSEQLLDLLGLHSIQRPDWLNSLHKIARYYSAIKSMMKLAIKQPEVFANISIRAVEAPDVRPFSLIEEKTPLLTLVKKLVKENPGITIKRLEEHLDTPDTDARLRRACRLKLTLHAEMQLVVFYEGSPSLVPRMQFIGTSKKACFLCYQYLLLHPLRLQVSACHQKIYPSWLPPPYYKTRGQFKSTPFLKLSRKIEQLTKQELKSALNVPRRPPNQDSTAGPSLTMTNSTSALGTRETANQFHPLEYIS